MSFSPFDYPLQQPIGQPTSGGLKQHGHAFSSRYKYR
jgi:hypothetical protein